MNPVEIAALDALDLLVVVDNESDTLSSVDKGVPQLPNSGDWSRVPILRRGLAGNARRLGVRLASIEAVCLSHWHAGIVNAALGALGAFGGEPIDVILGGYHLAGEGMEPRIEPTVHDLANRVRPRLPLRSARVVSGTNSPGATAGLHASRGPAATMKKASHRGLCAITGSLVCR